VVLDILFCFLMNIVVLDILLFCFFAGSPVSQK
jgi:hypothetical protein